MIHRYYRPELDVLRLIAFLLVFFTHRMDLAPIDSHIHPWRYNLSLIGVFGVPVFFLLSAFLITELLTREQQQTGKVHLKAFYTRRVLRIWPLYFAAFFGLAALTRFVPHAGITTPGSWLAFTLFSGNWYICKYGWLNAYPVNPLWSISVEEQFYLTIPLIARYGRRRGLIAICIGLLVVAYLAIFLYAQHPSAGFSSQWTNSFVQFQFFAAGTLLSLLLRGRLPELNLIFRAIIFVAAISCGLIAFLKFGVEADNPHPANALGSLTGWAFVLAGTILLFLALLGTSAKYLPKAAVYLGRISYGLYIFHAFVLFMVFHVWKVRLTELSLTLHLSYWRDALGTVITLALTILVAVLSYRFFEKPFLQLKKRFTFVPSRD
ncbi:acyltransferase [Acidobacterium sp. S8]|uniref:acyltransferase family protein n=1 Tax=Acidobacterium sp. S8 TaxID=1641854 RepID=UPI00131ADF78|nr:acyltransferase [Acidobacterium sp. S8]